MQQWKQSHGCKQQSRSHGFSFKLRPGAPLRKLGAADAAVMFSTIVIFPLAQRVTAHFIRDEIPHGGTGICVDAAAPGSPRTRLVAEEWTEAP